MYNLLTEEDVKRAIVLLEVKAISLNFTVVYSKLLKAGVQSYEYKDV